MDGWSMQSGVGERGMAKALHPDISESGSPPELRRGGGSDWDVKEAFFLLLLL